MKSSNCEGVNSEYLTVKLCIGHRPQLSSGFLNFIQRKCVHAAFLVQWRIEIIQ